MGAETDDLETKVEDAFVKLLQKEDADEIAGVYPWAEDTQDEPAIIVKATRGDAVTTTQDGDIVTVEVEITLKHAKQGVRRGLMRRVENGIGTIDATKECKSLPERLTEAAAGSLFIHSEPVFLPSSKEFEENKIVRRMGVRIGAAHLN